MEEDDHEVDATYTLPKGKAQRLLYYSVRET